MANIPTLKELQTAIIADIEAEFSTTLPIFGKNFLRALAAVQAGKLKLYYLLTGKVQKNIFVDTAESELIGGTLERFGRAKLGRNPFPATAGEYTVLITGTIGAIIPESTTFKSNDDSSSPGLLYILNSAYTLTGAPELITLLALDAGIDARLSVNDELTLTAPIALVDSVGVVTVETVIPQAAEDLEDYRRKALDAYRLEPQGGAGSDYRIWSSDVQSVEQVYPFAVNGVSGQGSLYVEATIADSTDGKGTPSGATLTAVEVAIESPTASRPSRKPLGVNVTYNAVTIKEIDIEITGFVGITVPIQTAIFNAIKSELSTIRPFVGSIDILADKNDIFDINKIISVILAANPGSQFGAVDLKVSTISVSTFQFLDGDIPHLNTITYV